MRYQRIAALVGSIAIILAATACDGDEELTLSDGTAATQATDPPSSTATAAESTEETTPVTPEEIAQEQHQAEEDLTVTPEDLLPDAAKCTNDEAIVLSPEVRVGDPAFRQMTDAVALPLKSQDPAEALKEVFDNNCRNPVVLDMSVQGLSEFSLPWGYKLGDHMPWMAEEMQKAGNGLMWSFLVKKSGHGDTIYVTPDMQQYAAFINTILLQGVQSGFMTLQSATNWHLPIMEPGTLNRTVLNEVQEGLPALVIDFTYKAQGCVGKVGYNQADMRFETFACVEAPPQAPPEAAPPAPPETPGTPTVTTIPTATTTPTGNPTTTASTAPPTTGPTTTASGRKPPTTTIAPSEPVTVPAPTVVATAPTLAPSEPTPPNITVENPADAPHTSSPDGHSGGTSGSPTSSVAPPVTAGTPSGGGQPTSP